MAGSPYAHSDRELLRRIARSAGGKAGYKQLIRELGLGGGRERRLLIEQLTRMVARGELRKLEDEMWAVPKPPTSDTETPSRGPAKTHRVTEDTQIPRQFTEKGGRERFSSGRLELHRDGYGFVRPDAGTRSAGAGTGRPEDIFIPPNGLHGAMHGDLVLVDEDPVGRDGRRSGRVARVLTRRNPTVVGIFHYSRPRGRRGRVSGDAAFDVATWDGNFVQPFDERLGGPIEIPEGAEMVSPEAVSPHRTLGHETGAYRPDLGQQEAQKSAESVLYPEATHGAAAASSPRFQPGSPGAGNRSIDENGSLKSQSDPPADLRWPLEGLAVEVEITSFPQPGRPARGRLVAVLGPPDAFGVDVEIMIRKHAIPHTFPAHVLDEADESARDTVATLTAEDLARREDFRSLPTVTIDGETARDFDDAVLVRPLANGNSELQVHIADVGWYVRAGSAVDTEARVRGTSVYFPDRAVPMLPHALSSGMCSLLPNEDRLVMSCIMEIDPRGEIVGYRVAEGMIRSARRMTYTSVQRCLNASPQAETWNRGADNASKQDGQSITSAPTAEDQIERERIGLEQPELPEAFDRMLELALRLNRKRTRRGSIDFDLPEPVVEFDPDGNMKAIVRSERGWAHRLIEEFMLSANECVATWLTAQAIPSLYRIHEMPDPKRIVEFEETAAAFGQTLGIGTLPVKRLTMKSDRRELQRRSSFGRGGRENRPQSHEIPERIPVTPQMYQRLVRRIAGKPEERILAYLMLRSLKQARYSETNEGHFALASPCYTHFTSPIRRYPDLIVHRLLRTMLRRGANPHGGPILSNDPQPWATELSRQRSGRSEADARRTSASPFAAPGSHPPQARPKFSHSHRESAANAAMYLDRESAGENARKRTRNSDSAASQGRIGWSTDSEEAPRTPELPRHSEPEPGLSLGDPISAEELANMATESSQAERRAADAERELIEWKKMKFMADKIGEDFSAIILSVTKFGFFVELDELFIEGLVPLGSLTGDFYSFRDADRSICGARTSHCFRVGDHVQVILDRIDRQQRRLQFALTPGTEPQAQSGDGAVRSDRTKAKKARAEARKAESKAPKTKGRKSRKR